MAFTNPVSLGTPFTVTLRQRAGGVGLSTGSVAVVVSRDLGYTYEGNSAVAGLLDQPTDALAEDLFVAMIERVTSSDHEFDSISDGQTLNGVSLASSTIETWQVSFSSSSVSTSIDFGSGTPFTANGLDGWTQFTSGDSPAQEYRVAFVGACGCVNPGSLPIDLVVLESDYIVNSGGGDNTDDDSDGIPATDIGTDDDSDGTPAGTDDDPGAIGYVLVGSGAAILVAGGAVIVSRTRQDAGPVKPVSMVSMEGGKGKGTGKKAGMGLTIGAAIDDLIAALSITELTVYVDSLTSDGMLDAALALALKLEFKARTKGSAKEYSETIEALSRCLDARKDKLAVKEVKEVRRKTLAAGKPPQDGVSGPGISGVRASMKTVLTRKTVRFDSKTAAAAAAGGGRGRSGSGAGRKTSGAGKRDRARSGSGAGKKSGKKGRSVSPTKKKVADNSAELYDVETVKMVVGKDRMSIFDAVTVGVVQYRPDGTLQSR